MFNSNRHIHQVETMLHDETMNDMQPPEPKHSSRIAVIIAYLWKWAKHDACQICHHTGLEQTQRDRRTEHHKICKQQSRYLNVRERKKERAYSQIHHNKKHTTNQMERELAAQHQRTLPTWNRPNFRSNSTVFATTVLSRLEKYTVKKRMPPDGPWRWGGGAYEGGLDRVSLDPHSQATGRGKSGRRSRGLHRNPAVAPSLAPPVLFYSRAEDALGLGLRPTMEQTGADARGGGGWRGRGGEGYS
jgi:hypothetical protein